MSRDAYGTLNPNAPARLADFAFLIGTWQGAGRTLNNDGTHSPTA